jgi:hypothetical protein
MAPKGYRTTRRPMRSTSPSLGSRVEAAFDFAKPPKQQPRDASLVTAIIRGWPKPWTMSVLADGPDEGESEDAFLQAQFDATIELIERDHCVLYGCWGDYDDHVRAGAWEAVVFPIGTKVLAAYRGHDD